MRYPRLPAALPNSPGIAITVLAFSGLLFFVASSVAADEPGTERAPTSGDARVLPVTYRVTLSLESDGDTREFSTTTAMRNFSLAPAEDSLRFRGRLWLQDDGRELLEFSIDLGGLIAQEDGSDAVARLGSWAGSAYVEPGRPARIVESPSSTVTVTLARE